MSGLVREASSTVVVSKFSETGGILESVSALELLARPYAQK